MQKVVHLLKVFKTIFYFNFFELGRVLFELVKNSNEFKILNLKFGITLTGLICIQTGHCGPRLHLSPPFCFPYPDPSPTRTCPCRAARPLHGALTPGCPLPCSPHTPLLLLIQHSDWSAATSPWIVVAATVSPPLPVSATSEALPVKWPCPSPSSLIPRAPGPQRCRLRPPECLTAVEPLPRRPHFHPPHRRPSPVSFCRPHLSRRHPIAALVATMKTVFGSGHRRALGECTTAHPARVRRVVTVSTPRSRHGPIDRLFPVGPRPWAKLPAHYCSLFFNF
jgi:hypothetical protein